MIFNDKNSILLSKRLKELREEKKLSHEKLCEQLQQAGVKIGLQSLKNFEVTEKRHSKFEAAKGMKAETLFNLAEFYGVSVDYLLGRTETQSIDNKVQAACEVTGLDEEAIKQIKSEITFMNDCNIISTLNALLTCNEFWSMVLNFSTLEEDSKEHIINRHNLTIGNLLDFESKTDIPRAEILKHIEKEFPYSKEKRGEYDYEEECNLSRYGAFRAVENMNNLFDHRCDLEYFDKAEIIEYLHLDRLEKKDVSENAEHNPTQE